MKSIINRSYDVTVYPYEDDAYSYFEEIDEYDDEMCAILSETVSLLYHDILSRSVPTPVSTVNTSLIF